MEGQKEDLDAKEESVMGLIYEKPAEEFKFNAELAQKAKGMNSDELKQTSLFGFLSKQEKQDSLASSKRDPKSSPIQPEDLKKSKPP